MKEEKEVMIVSIVFESWSTTSASSSSLEHLSAQERRVGRAGVDNDDGGAAAEVGDEDVNVISMDIVCGDGERGVEQEGGGAIKLQMSLPPSLFLSLCTSLCLSLFLSLSLSLSLPLSISLFLCLHLSLNSFV